MTATINVYKLPQVVNLTLAPTVGANLMNYSATRSDYKVVKGITTEVHFFIKNTDREPVTLADDETLEIVITDHKRTRTLLTKTLTLFDPVRSIWKLTLTKDEVADWPLANLSYSLVINRADDQVMLYLDRGYGGYSELLVIAGPYPEPRQPDEFIPADEFITLDGSLYSGAIAASVDPTFPQTAFSAAFYGSEFVGSVTIEATLDEQPESDDTMWFTAQSVDVSEEVTGIVPLNTIGAFTWIRIVIRADQGEISKVILQR